MMNIEMILASASPRRLELLSQVGIHPVVVPCNVDETVTQTDPCEVVAKLAGRKARAATGKYEGMDVVVTGADTVVSVDGKILGKPKTEKEACDMITLLQGRMHEVYTGVCMIFPGRGEEENFVEKTEVHVASMTEEEVLDYVSKGESMDKAGAYGIQGFFAAYISGIVGDYNNVVGLPVAHICEILRKKHLM